MHWITSRVYDVESIAGALAARQRRVSCEWIGQGYIVRTVLSLAAYTEEGVS